MQPTLYGQTSVPDFQQQMQFGSFPRSLAPNPDFVIPGRLKRFATFWFAGVGYDHIVAKAEGAMEPTADRPKKFLLFNLYIFIFERRNNS